MKTSKLEQLKIEREPERDSQRGRWPIVLVALALLAAAAWWLFFKPVAALTVSPAVARDISIQAASTVLTASGCVTARRQARVSA